jgi:CRP-like cAMP-binding protein
MVDTSELSTLLKHLVPKGISPAMVKNLLVLSSFVYFEEEDALLFKKGETPKGFYLLLGGMVYTETSRYRAYYGEGWMVGLEAFLKNAPVTTHWFSCANTPTLFIDRKCYLRCFGKNLHLRQLVEKQLTLG